MTKNYKMLIDGKWVDSDKKLEITNKYNQEVIATVPLANEELYEKAVQSAQKGFEAISSLPAYKRSKILQTTSELMRLPKRCLARLCPYPIR